jgi:hypothetical protein
MELVFIQSIQDSLANFLVENALFMAERFVAHQPCEQSKNLLAQCYIRLNKFYKVTLNTLVLSLSHPAKTHLSLKLTQLSIIAQFSAF